MSNFGSPGYRVVLFLTLSFHSLYIKVKRPFLGFSPVFRSRVQLDFMLNINSNRIFISISPLSYWFISLSLY